MNKISNISSRGKLMVFVQRGFATSSKPISIKLDPYQVHRLEIKDLPTETTTNKEELLNYYETMLRMRRTEIVADEYYKSKKIRGFCHLYDGQEAIIAGMDAILTYEDPLITAYRNHCIAMSRGESSYAVLAELMGRATGSSKGKGGSMHYYRAQNGYYGGHGIVGAQIPMGTGLAFALKYQKKPNVCATMYGDGAANQGQLFEASNMAMLWKLPCLYIIENNLYGMGTSNERASANPEFYKRGDVIPGIRLNAQNVFNVREITRFAKKHGVDGKGPMFLEMMTYRYHGHSMSDPGITYRKREEVTKARTERDPITYVRNIILDNKLMAEDEIKEIDKRIRKEVDEAALKAEKDPFPAPEELYTDIFQTGTTYIRGAEYHQSKFEY